MYIVCIGDWKSVKLAASICVIRRDYPLNLTISLGGRYYINLPLQGRKRIKLHKHLQSHTAGKFWSHHITPNLLILIHWLHHPTWKNSRHSGCSRRIYSFLLIAYWFVKKYYYSKSCKKGTEKKKKERRREAGAFVSDYFVIEFGFLLRRNTFKAMI